MDDEAWMREREEPYMKDLIKQHGEGECRCEKINVKIWIYNTNLSMFNLLMFNVSRVLGGCYALILFSRNMICQKMRNTVCLVERNPMQQEKAGNCSVTLWLWEGEEGGRVARFQSPTKVVVAQFWIFLATPWTFLWTFWGFFKFWQCTGAGDLLLTSGKD